MSSSTTTCNSTAGSTTRAYATFTPTWQRFTITDGTASTSSTKSSGTSPRSVSNPNGGDAASANPYLRQYSHVYSRRLAALRDRCLDAAKKNGSSSSAAKEAKLVGRILELQEDQPSTIVGTVAKEMPARPAVDTGYHSSAITASSYLGTVDARDLYVDPLGTYCSASSTGTAKNGPADDSNNPDKLYLEDESGRIELVDNGSNVLNGHALATGVVVAVTGSVKEGTGTMIVTSVHLPQFPDAAAHDDNDKMPEADSSASSTVKMAGPGNDVDGAPYLLLISGLGCGSSNFVVGDRTENPAGTAAAADAPEGSLDLRRDMVLDYLAGHSDPHHDGARVARVIVAGGGCATPQVLAELANATKTTSSSVVSGNGKGGGVKNSNASSPNDPSLPIKELDLFLSELCASGIPVDYVPGLHDPTTAVWPQRPLHPCLLPKSSTFEGMLHRSPNPYEATIGGKVVLGTDGRNVADLRRYMATVVEEGEREDDEDKKDESSMDVDDDGGKGEGNEKGPVLVPPTALETMESTICFAHIAPTGPDSLPTYPAFEHDPFVMEEKPDLYFAGNCDKYSTKITDDGTRLICIPSFDRTGQAVLVNVKTLDCEVISFVDA
mmetsp:Transcript_15338/g.33363  ORF Transcript_15338/g.33363 Transcript_15338/m.33363 type:complete len:609 (+) Transcript_15338:293-2119(+)|eukprot:CAMPEP_0178510052 /NCGR_PEP_ID=MMETSP0696-20121128/21620_1 /TAXON_ID=265572 /ORGANISM="Extubocellulus spinifer, Strain CCMP396" /LENGTH=608 /DNA_ID=CAMNT_0020139727 /DNA_START=266 /DNA_END=2092 /DNA_ORIENTATION=-